MSRPKCGLSKPTAGARHSPPRQWKVPPGETKGQSRCSLCRMDGGDASQAFTIPWRFLIDRNARKSNSSGTAVQLLKNDSAIWSTRLAFVEWTPALHYHLKH